MLEPLAKANQSMSRHQTFTKLVTDDKDFVGMVAYTIYKKEKLDWIEQFKVTHGDEPSEAELKQFTLASDSALRIQQYREIAESRVNDFIDNAIFEELEGYKKRLRDDEIVKASKKALLKAWARMCWRVLLVQVLSHFFSLEYGYIKSKIIQNLRSKPLNKYNKQQININSLYNWGFFIG